MRQLMCLIPRAEMADFVVFTATTCLCAFGALMLPLVG